MAVTITYSLSTILAESVANSYTSDFQLMPDVVALSNGGYVVAYNNANVFNGSVYLDFFDDSGALSGTYRTPFQGGTSAVGSPTITQLANGNVLVVWEENELTNQGLKGTLFTSTGTAIGSELSLTPISADFGAPDVTSLTGGGFAISYTDGNNALVRIHNNTGGLVTALNMESIATGSQFEPVITSLADGGFAVSFVDDSTGNDELYTRSYDADGTARTANPILVDATGENNDPTIAALSNGNYAIAYVDTSWGGESGTGGLTLEIRNANGGAVGVPIKINSPTTLYDEASPDITVLANGFIVVTWTSPTAAGSDIFGRIFDQTGNPLTINGNGSDFQLAAGSEVSSAVNTLIDGSFITVWQDNDTTDGSGGRITREENELTRTSTGDNTNNIIVGDEINDTIYGNDGFDWLYGGDGENSIFAGAGSTDVSLGGSGVDAIYGQDGFDYMYGYAGNDSLFGGNDTDVAYGGDGNDNLFGEADTDWLFGEDGNDIMSGGAAPDLMFGGAGADTINAGIGNDWIWGGTSNGLGDGAVDKFVFIDGWGVDVIYDFEDGTDLIDLSGSTASSFADLTTGQIAGGFTWIAYGGDVIYLWGAGNQSVGDSNITAADFLFV